MSATLVLDGVTIVDTAHRQQPRQRNTAVVVIEGGTIAKIAPAGTFGAGAADARGTFVVPGYVDAHAHPMNPPDPQDGLALMLAHGITGFRQMSGTPEMLAKRAGGTLMPATDAPELLEMPGEILTGANARTVDAAIAEVQKQRQSARRRFHQGDRRPPGRLFRGAGGEHAARLAVSRTSSPDRRRARSRARRPTVDRTSRAEGQRAARLFDR